MPVSPFFEIRAMQNFFSAFTTDVFRPLATLLIPGALGISTWFIALIWRFPKLERLAAQNRSEAALILFLATVFAGMVFEDFGARWEVQLDRWADARTNDQHTANWSRYLQTAFEADPIGRRYARTLVLRLKFELGIAISMISASLGIIWLALLGLQWRMVIVSELICMAFVSWGLLEAKATHKVLSKTRAVLLGDIRIVR
jgi:hypothetical protein